VAEIHRLTGSGLSIGPEPSVVECLEELLAQAKSGAIIGLGYFVVRGNDDVVWAWRPGSASAPLMVAGLSGIHHEMMSEWIGCAAGERPPPAA